MAKNRPNKKKSKPAVQQTTVAVRPVSSNNELKSPITEDMEKEIDKVIAETCAVEEVNEKSGNQYMRPAPVLTPIPQSSGQASPNVTFDRSHVVTYNKHMCSPGDVVYTSDVYNEKPDGGEDYVISKSHRPSLVIWEDGNLMRLLALSTSPGSIGTVTGNRRCAIPTTPEVAKVKPDAVSYVDHAQCVTANCSQITSIPLKISRSALDAIMIEDFKMTYLERGGSVIKILEACYEKDPNAFNMYQNHDEEMRLKNLIVNMQMQREQDKRRIDELIEENSRIDEAACGEALLKEQLELVLNAKDAEIKELKEQLEKKEETTTATSVNSEEHDELQKRVASQEATIEALKAEILHLKTTKNERIKPPTIRDRYDDTMAAAAYNAWINAEAKGTNKYVAFCSVLGIEYNPENTKSYGQIKRELKKMLVETKMIGPKEWK